MFAIDKTKRSQRGFSCQRFLEGPWTTSWVAVRLWPRGTPEVFDVAALGADTVLVTA
jgi:hypothetical protein